MKFRRTRRFFFFEKGRRRRRNTRVSCEVRAEVDKLVLLPDEELEIPAAMLGPPGIHAGDSRKRTKKKCEENVQNSPHVQS